MLEIMERVPSSWAEHNVGAMILADNRENALTAHGIWVELALLVAFTGGLLWYYRAKEVPWLVAACVFVSWLLGFMGTLLLPADVVLTLLNGEHRCVCPGRRKASQSPPPLSSLCVCACLSVCLLSREKQRCGR